MKHFSTPWIPAAIVLAFSNAVWAQSSLDGATGRISDVNLETRTFELLKETEYDPATGTGQSRFTVHWSESTVITRTEMLVDGFWQATIHGAPDAEGRFLISKMEVAPLPDPRLTDDPALPRVLVIGDSISMNYHEAAKKELAGIANYHRIEGNAFTSAHGVNNAELWLGNFQEKGLHWDVIQFNHGLHDIRQTYDAKTESWGEPQVSIEDYQTNLERLIAILRRTGAKLIWASTTPVQRDILGQYARRKDAAAEYNAAALEVMKRHPDILINDLHGMISSSSVFDAWRETSDVHFYKPEEQKALGEAVAQAVREAIKARE